VSARLAITDLVGPLGVRVAALRPAPSRQANLPVSTTASEALADSEALTRRLDGLGLPYGEYEGQTVVLIDGTDAATESLVAALNAYRVTIGLGSTVNDPAEIAASARQAAWTCRMAVSTRRPILDFADIGVHRLLLPGAEAADSEFEEPIHELERAQPDIGFDAVGTLVGYLDAGGNYRRAARDLTIHVNTLRYRLQRISGIIHADLDDPEQRFRLQLAARLQAGRRALRESGPG
jgi:DNA-binding PucR family transcriptional regulator